LAAHAVAIRSHQSTLRQIGGWMKKILADDGAVCLQITL
jgi:hypothetical protein